MTKTFTYLSFFVALFLCVDSMAFAPETLPIEGMLQWQDDRYVDSQVSLRFAIFTSELGTEEIWSEQIDEFRVRGGFFRVFLGKINSLPDALKDSEQELWLSMQVGTSSESLETLGRTSIVGVPQAMVAETCDFVGDIEKEAVQPLLSQPCPEGNYMVGYDKEAGQPICSADQTNSADRASLETMVSETCVESPAELSAAMQERYAASAHSHTGDDIVGGPSVAYTSGDGLNVLESVLSVTFYGDGDALASRSDHTHSEYAGAEHVHDGTDITSEVSDGYPVIDGVRGASDGITDGADDTEIGNVIFVATSGSPFNNIQSAIDSITDAAVDNQYLVRVAPGKYEGKINLKPFIKVQGSGRDITIIEDHSGAAGAASTVVMSSDSVLEELTVSWMDGVEHSVGIYAPPLLDRVVIRNVSVVMSSPSSISPLRLRGIGVEWQSDVLLDGVDVAVYSSQNSTEGFWSQGEIELVHSRIRMIAGIAVYVASRNFHIRDSEIECNSPNWSIAVLHYGDNLTLSNTKIVANAPSGAKAIYLSDFRETSWLDAVGVDIQANGNSDSVGVFFEQNTYGLVSHSSIKSTGYSVANAGEGTVSLYHTSLDGEIGEGDIACHFVNLGTVLTMDGSCPAATGCNNGTLDSGELCENGDSTSCTGLAGGATYSGGNAMCNSTCDGWNESTCEYCGDGVVNGTESCDPNSVTSTDCGVLDSAAWISGSATCETDCTWNTASCVDRPNCNNGIVEAGETCEAADTVQCTSLTSASSYHGGIASCNGTCDGWNESDCEFCGDGTTNGTESCDPNGTNSISCDVLDGATWGFGTATCTSGCIWDDSGCVDTPECGNGVLEDGEICETGETEACTALSGSTVYHGGIATCGSGCTEWSMSACQYCGDGTVNGSETCDPNSSITTVACADLDSSMWGSGDASCSNGCVWEITSCTAMPVCGNEVQEDGEDCDGTVCCESNCAFTTDGVSCTGGECDGAGECKSTNGW